MLSDVGEIWEDKAIVHDFVFGDITEEGPNYRDISSHAAGPARRN